MSRIFSHPNRTERLTRTQIGCKTYCAVTTWVDQEVRQLPTASAVACMLSCYTLSMSCSSALQPSLQRIWAWQHVAASHLKTARYEGSPVGLYAACCVAVRSIGYIMRSDALGTWRNMTGELFMKNNALLRVKHRVWNKGSYEIRKETNDLVCPRTPTSPLPPVTCRL